MIKKNLVKDTVKMGIGSMAGLGVMGVMSNDPNMPKEAKAVVPVAGASLGMLNVGQMYKNSMSIMPSTGKKYRKMKK